MGQRISADTGAAVEVRWRRGKPRIWDLDTLELKNEAAHGLICGLSTI